MTNSTETLTIRLRRFRTSYALRYVTLTDHDWTYYAAGKADAPALLLLPGGGGDAEALFRYIEGFAFDYRVIAPNLPASIITLGDAVSGLRALLAHENIHKAHVVGLSWGAILAQLYIRRFGDTVADMILTHTVIPSAHLAETTRMQRDLMRVYPSPLLLWLSRRAFRRGIANSSVRASSAERDFWMRYVDEMYRERISKPQLIARASISADFHANHQFKSNDLNGWYGDLLIIQSEEDDVIDDGDRGALLGMYPRAFVQTLVGYDHLAPLLAADDLLASMSKFLHK